MTQAEPAYLFDRLLGPDGWQAEATVVIDGVGRIKEIRAARAGDDKVGGIALPGMANAHSHAFQWALAGRTEPKGGKGADFWSWRQVMYNAVEMLEPPDLFHIARAAYTRMLEAGYTSVAEFHYLHRDKTGARYANPAEMSLALASAADEAGIALTLLPALYTRGGFDDRPLEGAQRRFFLDADDFIVLAEFIAVRPGARTQVGLALHSLRAVPPAVIATVGELRREVNPEMPIHIHIAEQPKEVAECEEILGASPIRWLNGAVEIDTSWHLVHATHADEDELTEIAAFAGSVVLCPTTEANLADGPFDLDSFLDAGGRMAIGSDSHVEIDPFAELRLLDYGRRLKTGRRHVASRKHGPGVGERLWADAAAAGAGAVSRAAGGLAPGQPADIVVLSLGDPRFSGASADQLMDGIIFGRWQAPVDRVMVGGEWKVEGGRHVKRESLDAGLDQTLRKIVES